METFSHLLAILRDPQQLLAVGGYLGLVLIVFAETGLLIGFLLPGDSLLVTAGLLAATEVVHLNLLWLIILVGLAAILGDAVGYRIGLHMGRHLFRRPDGRFLKRSYLLRTQAFYERHGGKTILLARFVPIVRTFAPIVAGVTGMPYGRFVAWNIAGGAGWVLGLLGCGYFLGRAIPGLATHIDLLVLLIITISLVPLLVESLRHRRVRCAAMDALRQHIPG